MEDHEPKPIDPKELGVNESVVASTPLAIPRDSRGRIRWSVLRKDPALLNCIIEGQSSSVISQEIKLTQKSLNEHGFSSLACAITGYYPNRYNGLRQKLGLLEENEQEYKDQPKATQRDPLQEIPRNKKGHICWSKLRDNHELLITTIESEAKALIDGGSRLTQQALQIAKKSGLSRAITRYYPGSFNGLNEKFGISSRKPADYWTTERIEAEATEFYRQFGRLTSRLLRSHGKADLANMINKRPNGYKVLKEKLGIELNRKDSYWTTERIEAEAQDFINKYGGLSADLLERHKRYDLKASIKKKYPGQLQGLKNRFGLNSRTKRLDGYWTIEVIEQEAMSVLATNGNLNRTLLLRLKMGALDSAIRTKYPGGWEQLKLKLNIETTSEPGEIETKISSKDADEALGRLIR